VREKGFLLSPAALESQSTQREKQEYGSRIKGQGNRNLNPVFFPSLRPLRLCERQKLFCPFFPLPFIPSRQGRGISNSYEFINNGSGNRD
jgi:hypothetical protein